jgi:hypothetical protein
MDWFTNETLIINFLFETIRYRNDFENEDFQFYDRDGTIIKVHLEEMHFYNMVKSSSLWLYARNVKFQ